MRFYSSQTAIKEIILEIIKVPKAQSFGTLLRYLVERLALDTLINQDYN